MTTLNDNTEVTGDELTFEKIGYTLRCGAVRFNDLCYVLGSDPALEGHTHTAFWEFDQGNWQFVDATPHTAHSMCVVQHPKHQAVAIGTSGYVHIMGSGDNFDEQIEVPGEQILRIRSVNNVGGYAYACGMNRQVFKRDDDGGWLAMHDAMPTLPSREPVFGFEAIHGIDEDHVYAVGWNGEIWHFNGAQWTQCSSPSNLILTGVVVTDDATAYACGQYGTLLKTVNGEWQVIDQKITTSNFWGITWFNDELYVSSMDGVFVLRENELEPVDFGDVEPESFYGLSNADGLLWSVGEKEILSYDGTEWTKVY